MGDAKTLDTVPSESATYADQKTFGVIAGRSHVEISPKYGGDYKPGDIIRLEVPAQAYLDPNEFYIHMRTQIYAGAGNQTGLDTTLPQQFQEINPKTGSTRATGRLATCQFVPGIQSVFSRVRLLAGSVVLEDIQDYPTLYRMLLETTSDKGWREGDGFLNEGVYDPTDFEQRVTNANFHAIRSTFGTDNQGHVYAFRPLFGLLAAGKYIPLKYMGQLTIELYLENQQEVLWSTTSVIGNAATTRNMFHSVAPIGTFPDKSVDASASAMSAHSTTAAAVVDYPNATYTVHDVRMHVPFVHPIESFDQAMMRQIEAGEVSIFHSSWSAHTRQIPAPTKTSLSFQERALSLKGALSCMRNSKSIRAIDEDFSFPANGIQEYQWKLGSEYIPAQPINCLNGGSRALAELRKGLGLYGDDDAQNMLTEENFLPVEIPNQLDTINFSELRRGASQPGSFFMALDLEKSSGQASGFDSAASSVDIELLMTLTPHRTVVGQVTVPSVASFRGAHSTANFQPSKRRVIASTLAQTGELTEQSWGDMHEVWNAKLLATSSSRRWIHGVPEGFMQDKNLIYTFDDGVETTHNPASTIAVTDNSSGNYARVYFYAHIDQVLRLSAVGRMEIVR